MSAEPRPQAAQMSSGIRNAVTTSITSLNTGISAVFMVLDAYEQLPPDERDVDGLATLRWALQRVADDIDNTAQMWARSL